MSINNVIFFRDCINYLPDRITEHGTTTVIPEMSDKQLFHVFKRHRY